MTPDEALKVAIEINDLKWVQELLNRYRCNLRDVMARSQPSGRRQFDHQGHIQRQECVIKAINKTITLLDTDDIVDIMDEGALAAVRNGHVTIVERLFPIVIRRAYTSLPPVVDWFDVVRHVLGEGAAHGQLPVVKLMVDHALTRRYRDEIPREDLNDDGTLSKAIRVGQSGVVEYLVNVSGISWNLKNVFIAAVDKGQVSLAERIRELYPQERLVRGQNLFIDVACSGGLNAVKYLYNNGYNDSELVREAFIEAAYDAQDRVVEFLAGTGCMASKVLEIAFESACSGISLNVSTLSRSFTI
ncbi:hypothetical protein P3T76_007262 [Phytophthora citrophthora]|uniref:Uncharacterized protein n=1 Tax=Phytophthora citrophthora TaxID=4793 RepID=A0AAD9GMY3_9STRA|nr:hypothetical protein P3T76_007262 [Phytophthora citrophthora]